MKVRVSVPATSANLGAGFDVFGIAVKLSNEFVIEDAEKFTIKINMRHTGISPTKNNLFYKSFSYLFKKVQEKIPEVKIQMNIQIPPRRGLGSSATAVVGGLLAANAFLDYTFSKEQLLSFAVELEAGNNPDNVAAALFGGLVILAKNINNYSTVTLPFPKHIKAIFFIPDFAMDTIRGRNLLPDHYSREEVIFNISRVALFLAALQSKQYELLRVAMQDKIHQPARTKIFRLIPEIIEAAQNAGALGAALSGGGSSILAFAYGNSAVIADAMVKVGKQNGITAYTTILEVANQGATCTISNGSSLKKDL